MIRLDTQIRQATQDDVEAIARVHVGGWQAAYRGAMPDDYLDSLDTGRRARHWANALDDATRLVLVASQGEAIVGFAALNPSRDPGAATHTGEIAAIYVDPRLWRTGCGSLLLDGAVQAARTRTFRELTLWVLESNRSARAFYEAREFAADGHEKTAELPGFSIPEVRYCRKLA